MEDLSVCKACKVKYTYTEYSDWTPEDVLGSALGKIKDLNFTGYKKREVICSCGTYPEVTLSYEKNTKE